MADFNTQKWKETPQSGPEWAQHPIRNDGEETVSITVPKVYRPTDLEGGTVSPKIVEDWPVVTRQGVDAIFKYYGKDMGSLEEDATGYKILGTEEPYVRVGVMEQYFMELVNGGVVELNDKPTAAVKVLYRVIIDKDHGWDFFKRASDDPLKGYDFFADPRSREIGCIDFKRFRTVGNATEPAQITRIKGLLSSFSDQIKQFNKKGGVLKPPINMDELMNEVNMFMTALETFLMKAGQGYNLVSDTAGLSLKNLYNKKAKLYFGIDFDYEPYFAVLEVQGPKPGTGLGLQDLTIPTVNLLASGNLMPDGKFRINLMRGVEDLKQYKRGLGLVLRADEFISESKRALSPPPTPDEGEDSNE